MESLVYSLREQVVAWRRVIHAHAEPAWLEVWTAAFVAATLTEMGYRVKAGKEVISEGHRVAMPSQSEMRQATEWALQNGADPAWVEVVRDGFTGVVAEINTGRPGPTIAMRFDIDANNLTEDTRSDHRPYRLGFASRRQGACHGCGHDGHAAIGLGVAKVLKSLEGDLNGRFRLIFQPAEEGSRGARAMLAAGVLEDVDFFLSGHLGFGARKSGQLICGTTGFLATSKTDVLFTGVPAHAGASPESGRNALLAAAAVSLALHAIPRHSAGASRINVGVLQAGEGRNVIPATARISFETRGSTTEIDRFMMDEALRVISGQSTSYGVDHRVIPMGGAPGSDSDRELIDVVKRVAVRDPSVREIIDLWDFGASEDVTYMMDAVRSGGGKATYMMFGADMAAPHHNGGFDFDEEALITAVHVMCLTAVELSKSLA
ncbi:MAG TPA: amidohydrolase [Bacillota bacterium]|nr:amidohydrolase [Bacillota bacterium]